MKWLLAILNFLISIFKIQKKEKEKVAKLYVNLDINKNLIIENRGEFETFLTGFASDSSKKLEIVLSWYENNYKKENEKYFKVIR
jgi:hypothetical protein